MTIFLRAIGIDYSGAKKSVSGLPGLRVYMAQTGNRPIEILPIYNSRKYWSRKCLAHWLVETLADEVPSIVGIDHGFSFPMQYFEAHCLKLEWAFFLDDFTHHWPTDKDHIDVDLVRSGYVGNGTSRAGNSRWRRLTEQRAGRAKSVFHFDVPGQVAKSTHAGIPWLRFIRKYLKTKVHFWPYDGWQIPMDRSTIVEVYPSLWSNNFDRDGRSMDQHDAFSVAAWLSEMNGTGELKKFFSPKLNKREKKIGRIEGWILGVM